jgi:hypothetical protein
MSNTPQNLNMSPAPVKTASEADALISEVMVVMAELADVVQQETALVRAGRVSAASKFAEPKSDLSRRYVAGTIQLKASKPQLTHVARDRLAALQKHHESLRTLLQTNLTVLATAHAVSESVVRGVSNEIGRRSTPQTYGASGRANVPTRAAGVPLAISRTL